MGYHAIESSKASVVTGGAAFRSRQGPEYLPGISDETVGARNIWLGIVKLNPGQRTSAHIHDRHESAFYLLQGAEIELWSGHRLEHCDKARPGDFLYIPAGIPHVAVNRGTECAVFLGGRNDPTAQESLTLLPDFDALVP